MRVVFMGSSKFSIPALLGLHGSGIHDVVAVYTKQPKPKGRGYLLAKTSVHELAEKVGIAVRYPASLTAEGEEAVIREISPDVIVVSSYGLKLPEWTLATPRFGCVNIHPSLLPRWRGAAPVQSAIMAGDAVTGVSIMKMNNLMDAGDVYLQERTEIGDKENINDLSARLAEMGTRLLLEVLGNIANITPRPQDEGQVTFANKPTEFRVNFNESAQDICRKIRALYPKVFFMLDGKRVRLLEAGCYESAESGRVGSVVGNDMRIQCGFGTILAPKVVQPESRTPCDIKSFLSRFKGKAIPTVT
ncbi:methionyl-tRNA formyltransferase [Anaplasma platys]|uniref:methionyl-tRNA formyltransferase n=1 Tax=Anaplasma platys TaxID=949 RepID=UPI00145CCFFA|nr:methionyl-tRNA formyltransferase [Anaplasma platys]